MANRAGVMVATICAAGVALAGTGVTIRAQTGARVTTVAELADMPLGVFHNNLFPYASDQIVDDHGVRLGSRRMRARSSSPCRAHSTTRLPLWAARHETYGFSVSTSDPNR